MNESIATHFPANSFRGFVARTWADPESRSTVIGVLGVLLIHLILWLIVPILFRMDPISALNRPAAAPRTFSIEFAPDTFAKPPPPKPLPSKFVETNPDAPENTPDKTNNFAAQNQQVAQEKPTPNGKNDMPALEGQKEIQTTQIVTGQLAKPIEHIEAVQPPLDVPQTDTPVTPPKAEQNPLAGFEKKEGESKEGFGSNVAKMPDNSRPIPEKIEGAKDVPVVDGAIAMQPAIDPKRPRARPTVVKQQQVRPAIFTENKFGTANIGPTAVDAKWSNYGAYLQRLIEAVDVEWNNILASSKTYPGGTYVSVKFILDSEGRVARIVDVDNHSTDQGSRSCVSAITNRAPYGVWTDDMKAILGEQQEMTFTFYYNQ